MPNRKIPFLKLEKSPLVLVIAQVRISSVLGMENYLPKIQEPLRKAGFPKFKAEQTQNIVAGPVPQFISSVRWLFHNADNTECVVLATDFIALLTSKYDVFEAFIGKLQTVLQVLNEAVGVELALRLGLRYVDLIRPVEGKSLADYLQPGLLGLPPAELGVESFLTQFDSRGKTPVGNLTVKLHQNKKGLFIPPDVTGSDLKFDVVLKPGETITLLDIDHSSPAQRPFKPDALANAMWDLHEHSALAFRKATIPSALDLWGAVQSKAKE